MMHTVIPSYRHYLLVLIQLIIPSVFIFAHSLHNDPEKINTCHDTSFRINSSVNNSSTIIQPVTNGLWYQAAVWPNGQLPTMNDDVYIPSGMTIHMAGTCRARTIEVAGTLRAVNWQITGAWIELQTKAILVLNGGLLQIGTAENPYLANCNMTLIGNDPSEEITPMMGTKFIGAMSGGTIELHGTAKKSWTQLNETAQAGSSEIVLKENVNWSVNDEIVIASTAFDMNQAEQRTVTQVNGKIVTLDSALQYTHFGHLQTYTRPDDSSLSWVLDERAEVGLLSKNITIQGDISSDSTGFGGHMMAMQGATMNANHIELTRMGQKGKLGRYPWHWHLLGNGGQGQFIKNSSVHHTYNRAITIHATNRTVVERNVAFDNVGHAFFFEDGNEVDNVMQYNLGLVTKRPQAADALLPSDLDNSRNMSGPATFWISHPHNKINFNHAAGSDGSGIWFAPHQNINSEAYVTGLDPNKLSLPLGNLDNNVAHSSTHGLLIGPTILPNDESQTVNPNYDYLPRSALGRISPIIKNYTLYKNKLGAYLRVGQNTLASYFENLIIADNYKGDAFTWNGEMNKCLWVGGSDNFEPHPVASSASIGGAEGLVHMHTIYDGPVRVRNSYFADLITSDMSLFDQWGANVKYTGHTFRNTTVMPGSYRVNFRDLPKEPIWSNAVAYDIDGSLTNTPMTAIHHNIPILSDHTTSLIAGDTNGAHSNNRYCYVEVRPSDGWDCAFDNTRKRQRSVFRRSDGAVQHDDKLAVQGVSLVPVVDGKYTYTLTFEKEIPYRVKLDYHSMNAGEYVIIGFPESPSDMNVYTTTQTCPYSNMSTTIPEVSSLEKLKNTTGSAFAFEGTTLYTRYQAPAGANFEDAGTLGSLVLCLYGNCAEGPNLAFKDSDGDNTKDVLELYSCRDPFDAKDLELVFTYNTFDFTKHQIDAQAIRADYWLMRADQKADPFIYKDFNFDGSQIKTIEFKTRCETSGTYQFRWKTASENFYNAQKMRTFNYSANQLVTLSADMTNDPSWENQTITGLRIDFPVNVNANVHTWLYSIQGAEAQDADCYFHDNSPECYTSFIDFENSVDNRGSVARSSTSISISQLSASSYCSGSNQFTVSRTGTATDGYADLHIEPTTPLNWSVYEEINFDICGGNVPYTIHIRDSTFGYTRLGKSLTGGDNSFILPADTTRKDEIDDLIVRVFNSDLPGNIPVTFSLSTIKLFDATGCENCVDYISKFDYPDINAPASAKIGIITNGKVSATNTVHYNAGNSIELLSRFEVELGATYQASIAPCN